MHWVHRDVGIILLVCTILCGAPRAYSGNVKQFNSCVEQLGCETIRVWNAKTGETAAVELLIYNDGHDFQQRIWGRTGPRAPSTKVHQLFLTFVCWLECLAESLQRGSCLCRVRRRLGYGEVKTQLRIEVVLRAGAHNVRVWVNTRQP